MLDSIDKKLLLTLLKDARAPITKITRTPGLTREIVRYRMQKLEEKGIIKAYVAKIHQPFFVAGVANMKLKLQTANTNINKIIETLKKNNKVNWIARLAGNYDLSFTIQYIDISDLAKTTNEIQMKIGSDIQEHQTILYIEELKFSREGLISEKKDIEYEKLPSFGKQNEVKLLPGDEIILKELATNCRIKNSELSEKTKLGEDVIRLRIKRLERSGIIRGYTIIIDTNKIGYEGYQLGLKFNHFSTNIRNKVKEYVNRNPYISFCTHSSGEYQVIISLQTKNRNQFTEILDDIRLFFNEELQQYTFQLQLDEHKEVYLPEIVVESKL